MRYAFLALPIVLAGCSPSPSNSGSDMGSAQAKAAADMEKAHERIQIMKDAMTQAENKSPEEARRIIAEAHRKVDELR